MCIDGHRAKAPRVVSHMKHQNKSLEARSISSFYLMCTLACSCARLQQAERARCVERGRGWTRKTEREGWEVLAVLLRGTEE